MPGMTMAYPALVPSEIVTMTPRQISSYIRWHNSHRRPEATNGS